jgi:hypothetical protein
LKRKQADRSPEAAKSSPSRPNLATVIIPARPLKRQSATSLSTHWTQNSDSPLNVSPIGLMGPPLSATPSTYSFSGRSDVSGGQSSQYAVERLRLKLAESQEDLRLERERAMHRERLYEEEIAELEKSLARERGSDKKGKRRAM